MGRDGVLGLFRGPFAGALPLSAFNRPIGPRYFVGVDLGQSRDPTAIAVVRRVGLTDPAAAAEPGRKPEPVYALGSLEWQRQQAEREGRLPAIGVSPRAA